MRDGIVLLLLVAIGVGLRVVGEIPNFQPIVAIALFGGFFFSRRWIGCVAVLLSMTISDLVMGHYLVTPVALIVTVYACLLLPVLIGRLISRDRLSAFPFFGKVVGSSLASSLIFFAVTNGAAWLMMSIYPKTLAGLGQCYVAGIPFLRNPLIGDLMFSMLLFGSWYAVTQMQLAVATKKSDH